MRLNIRFDNPLTVSAPAIEAELHGISEALNRIAAALEPEKATRLNGSFSEEPLQQKGNSTMVPTGNHSFDQVAVRLTISPDGAIDGTPTWQTDNGIVTLEPTGDGLQCRCTSTGEVTLPVSVTVVVAVDDPSTPDLETISEVFQMTWSHSKATNLNPGFGEEPL